METGSQGKCEQVGDCEAGAGECECAGDHNASVLLYTVKPVEDNDLQASYNWPL